MKMPRQYSIKEEILFSNNSMINDEDIYEATFQAIEKLDVNSDGKTLIKLILKMMVKNSFGK